MQRFRIFGALAAIALSAGLLSATSSQAATAGRVITVSGSAANGAAARSEQVKYADLDLNLSDDQRTLESRVKAAIKRVCSEDATCAKQSWRAASSQIARATPIMN